MSIEIDNREDADEDEIVVDISDEGEAEKPKKEPKDDDGDERLSSDQRDDEDADRAGETEEQKRERRRKERKEKNENKKMYRLRDEAIMQSQAQELQALKQMIGELTQRTTQRDASDLDAATNHWSSEAKRAAQAKQQAIQDGDGQKFAQAEAYEREALRRAQHFAELRRRPAPAPQAQSIDPVVADHAKTFMERFDWYDPNGSDDLSRTVQALDNGVARDGYDPRQPAYWEELEARMKRRIPPNLLNDDDEPAAPKRRGPPVGGRSDAATPSRSVTIPREFREALEQAGLWDDPKRRERAVREYLKARKEAS